MLIDHRHAGQPVEREPFGQGGNRRLVGDPVAVTGHDLANGGGGLVGHGGSPCAGGSSARSGFSIVQPRALPSPTVSTLFPPAPRAERLEPPGASLPQTTILDVDHAGVSLWMRASTWPARGSMAIANVRSEERRVGKGGRGREWPLRDR